MNENNADERFRYSHKYFLQNMLFDLRTSAATIDGFSQLLAEGIDGSLNSKQTSHVEIIRKSGLKINFLLDLLIYVERFDKGYWDSEEASEAVNLKKLVDEALDISGSFGSLRVTSNVEIDNEVSQSLSSIKARKELLTTIIRLMIMSAIHATKSCSKVQIKSQATDKWIDLFVVSNPDETHSKFNDLQPKRPFRNIYDAIELETKDIQKEGITHFFYGSVLLAVVHGLSTIHQAELRMKLSELSSDIILRIPTNAG